MQHEISSMAAKLRAEESGGSTIEYIVIAGALSIGAIACLSAFTQQIVTMAYEGAYYIEWLVSSR